MGLVAANVMTGVTGAIYVGPVGLVMPSTHNAAIIGASDIGFVSKEGVKESRDVSTDKVQAWQNAATVRELVTDANYTLQFTMIETNRRTLGIYYATSIDASGKIRVYAGSMGGRMAWIFDVIDGAMMKRFLIPSGEITKVGEVVYANGKEVGYEVTLTTYPDASINGANAEILHANLAA